MHRIYKYSDIKVVDIEVNDAGIAMICHEEVDGKAVNMAPPRTRRSREEECTP